MDGLSIDYAEQQGTTYLFDFASEVGAAQEDRTVAAWTVTPATVGKRDVLYQRKFPSPPESEGTRWTGDI
jgi:hypothetical protein